MKNILPFKPLPTDNREKTDFALSAHRFIWSEMGVVTILWATLSIAFPFGSYIWLTFYLPTMVASLVGLWLNERGETRGTVMVLLTSGWTVFTMIAIFYWRVIPADNNRYIIIVVAAALLLGKRAGIFAAVMCGLTEIGLAFWMRSETIASVAQHFPLSTLLPHLFFLYLATLVPALATRGVRLALKIAEEERDELRRAEETSAENEARFLSIVDNSPDAIVIHSDGRFVHLNPSSLDFVRAGSPDRLLGKSILEIVHPDHRDLVATALSGMEGTKGTASRIREGKMMRLDGSVAQVETASMPVSFEGKPAIQTIVRDMTELKRMEEQIYLQVAALDSAANGIVITDREGTVVWVNAAFESLTGYSFQEAVGKNSRELLKSGKQTDAFYRDMWETILSGKVWHGELVNRRKDNTLYSESMTITPVLDMEGIITHFVAVKQDITSRILLEEQLLQSQKLEGIGQLAGGVAHDYNNILNVVVGYSELLKRKLGEDDPARRSVEAIHSAAKRGADLTRQLLAFARKEIVSPKVISVNSAIDSIRNMLHRVIGENLKLVFVPGKELWNVKIDPTQLDQVIVNLATNARDAIEDVGTITITTSNFSKSDNGTSVHSNLKAGEYVRITIEDSGKGMDAKTLNRIFEPFFTTKPKGHGTGLGLSTVYGIVKQNGGTVEAESEPGKGTKVTVYLPKFGGEVISSVDQNADESLRGVETVLVVEDQPDLLNMTKTTLEEYGYNVITSLDPSDAELLSEAYAGEIHLLLTDVVMPKMSGRELSEKVSGHRPGMKTLFMSGYGSGALTQDGVPYQGNEFIQKPFSITELARKVRETLSS